MLSICFLGTGNKVEECHVGLLSPEEWEIEEWHQPGGLENESFELRKEPFTK